MNVLNKLTIKDLKMNRKRTITTIIGIMLSVALLTIVATLFFSAKDSIIQFCKQKNGDFHYVLTDVSQDELLKLEQNRKVENLYVIKTGETMDAYLRLTKGALQSNYVISENAIANKELISLEVGILQNSNLKSYMLTAGIVACIIMGASIFYIRSSLVLSMNEKIKQYGMLSSIGATKKQIRKSVHLEAMYLGAIGILLGIIVGIFSTYILIKVCGHLLEDVLTFELAFSFSWLAMLVSIVLGVITIFISTEESVYIAGAITPMQAIRNQKEITIQAKETKVPKWICKYFGIGGSLAYKNLQRCESKYKTTVVSIFICVGMFIALSSFVDIGFSIVREEMDSMRHNIIVGYDGRLEIFATLDAIREIEEVEEVIGVGTNYITIETTRDYYTQEYLELHPDAGTGTKMSNINVQLVVIDEKSFKTYIDQNGLDYEQVKDQGVFDNSTNDGIMMFQPEKTNCFEGVLGAGGELLKISIAKVSEKAPVKAEHISSIKIILGMDSYKQLIENQQTYTLQIQTKAASKTEDDLENMLTEYREEANWFYVHNKEEELKDLRSFYLMVNIFLCVFIFTIALIGISNIVNTISTNLQLRRREFAVLKSMGMTKREFHRMMLVESFFYGTKSLLKAIPVGLFFSFVIYWSMTKENGFDISYHMPLEAIASSVIVVFLLLFACMKYSMRKVHQYNIIETIRNENI